MKKTPISFCALGLTLAAGVWTATPSYAELQLNPGTPQRNERFYVGSDRAFIGGTLDFSGVGNSDFDNNINTSKWLTMIAPSYFITSNHLTPNVGSNPVFRANDGSTTDLYNGTVVRYARIQNTDLLVGELSVQVPSNVAKYAIVPPSMIASGDLYVVGQGAIGMKVGKNFFSRQVNGQEIQGVGAGVGDVFEFDFNSDNTGLGSDEALLQAGDSGAPTFLAVGGVLALAGEHWYTGPTGAPTKSGDTFIGRYASEIQTTVSAMSNGTQSVTIVPEPATGMLLLGLPALFLRRRRTVA